MAVLFVRVTCVIVNYVTVSNAAHTAHTAHTARYQLCL